MHLPTDTDTDLDFVRTGTRVGPGEYSCVACGHLERVASGGKRLPECPACGAPAEWEIIAVEHRHEGA